MPNLDRLEIRIDRSPAPWSQGKNFCAAEIYINDRSLIEWVQELEQPWIDAEIQKRLAEGDQAATALRAGDYWYLPPAMILLPCRNLLDEPWNPFALESDAPRVGKSTILGCTCGVIECWFLQVQITFGQSIVKWSNFVQFHRDWQYPLSFQFDRQQYLAQLNKSS